METILKASITNTFGLILEMDATKKVCCKLAGDAAFSANSCVNVSYDNGEILQCVLTSSVCPNIIESASSMQPMADGLMDCYAKACAQVPPVLYMNRNC